MPLNLRNTWLLCSLSPGGVVRIISLLIFDNAILIP